MLRPVVNSHCFLCRPVHDSLLGHPCQDVAYCFRSYKWTLKSHYCQLINNFIAFNSPLISTHSNWTQKWSCLSIYLITSSIGCITSNEMKIMNWKAAPPVQSQVISREIHGEQSGTGDMFSFDFLYSAIASYSSVTTSSSVWHPWPGSTSLFFIMGPSST